MVAEHGRTGRGDNDVLPGWMRTGGGVSRGVATEVVPEDQHRDVTADTQSVAQVEQEQSQTQTKQVQVQQGELQKGGEQEHNKFPGNEDQIPVYVNPTVGIFPNFADLVLLEGDLCANIEEFGEVLVVLVLVAAPQSSAPAETE